MFSLSPHNGVMVRKSRFSLPIFSNPSVCSSSISSWSGYLEWWMLRNSSGRACCDIDLPGAPVVHEEGLDTLEHVLVQVGAESGIIISSQEHIRHFFVVGCESGGARSFSVGVFAAGVDPWMREE